MIVSGDDGVTHINVYSKGITQTGRWLSNFAYSPITLQDDGKFDSIEGYWYWLLSGDERLRKLSGFEAKRIGKESITEPKNMTEEFEGKIRKAIDVKLKTHLEKSKVMCETELPLCHYYEYSGKRVDAGYEWIIEHIEHRRSMLKEYFKNGIKGDSKGDS